MRRRKAVQAIKDLSNLAFKEHEGTNIMDEPIDSVRSREQTVGASDMSGTVRDRRGLLLGLAAGVGGLAACMFADSQPAAAGTGDGSNVQLGEDNGGAAARTGIFYNPGGPTNTYVATLADPEDQTGVLGEDNSGDSASTGVTGRSGAGAGVFGGGGGVSKSSLSFQPNYAIGVLGIGSADGVGVVAANADPNNHDALYAVGLSAFFGDVIIAPGSSIVTPGERASSRVRSKAGSSAALSVNNAAGTALEIDGAVSFTRSGVFKAVGSKSSPLASVRVAITGAPLVAASLVLTTIQGAPVPGVAIASVAPKVGAPEFTINFTSLLRSTMHIAWFVLG